MILLDWIRQAEPKHLILVHGEQETLRAFADRIQQDLSLESHIAVSQETIEI